MIQHYPNSGPSNTPNFGIHQRQEPSRKDGLTEAQAFRAEVAERLRELMGPASQRRLAVTLNTGWADKENPRPVWENPPLKLSARELTVCDILKALEGEA